LIAASPEAVQLFHEGLIALSQVEQNGIRIDEEYLDRTLRETGEEINALKNELRADKVYRKKWRKRFGEKAKLTSPQQLEKVIFDDLGFKRTGRKTDHGQESADESAFEFVDHPFVKKYFRMKKKEKARQYLCDMQSETVDGWSHPFLDLHKVGSYRSSSSDFNIQNPPVRDLMQAEMVRRAIIAPKGFRIGEIDLSGAEVCGACCYNKDPKLIDYVTNPDSDMHRDIAMQVYMLKRKDIVKNSFDEKRIIRYCAKNKAVFPWFYGSWFGEISKSLWEAIELYDLKTAEGIPLKKHLKKKGIKEPGEAESNWDTGKISTPEGTFVDHIRKIQEDFWGNRFTVYDEWKKRWWKKYLKLAYFRYKTGFVGRGLYSKRQVCNYPIQGSSFHFLLWSLIQLQNWMNKHKLKSRIAFEIHDSIGIYFHKKEIDDVIEKATKIMTKDILKHWSWIIVPLSVEVEIAPPGGSWFHKTKNWREA
jgi:DNA polymerase-1